MGDYPPVQTLTGTVVAVSDDARGEIESVTIRTDGGAETAIGVDPSVLTNNGSLPAEELHERLTTAQPIEVEFTYHCNEAGMMLYRDSNR